jgi:hypothetical protein
MKVVKMILESKASSAQTWYGALINEPAGMLMGASAGLILGFVFILGTLKLPCPRFAPRSPGK